MLSGFHDCVGVCCNGCIDLSLDSNKGLDEVVEKFDKVYEKNKVQKFISRADLWAFAGIVAVEQGVKWNNIMCNQKKKITSSTDCKMMPEPNFSFKVGRLDCDQKKSNVAVPNKNGFPDVDMTRVAMMQWYKDDFGFDEDEVTALMGGAHSLGGAKTKNSGFHGDFTKDKRKLFNTDVYKFLISENIDYRSEVCMSKSCILFGFFLVCFFNTAII